MDLKTVKLNCLTLGESKGFPKISPKKVEYPFKSGLILASLKMPKMHLSCFP